MRNPQEAGFRLARNDSGEQIATGDCAPGRNFARRIPNRIGPLCLGDPNSNPSGIHDAKGARMRESMTEYRVKDVRGGLGQPPAVRRPERLFLVKFAKPL
jgi:hypothetical protein